ncbi:MAG: hypothetical protein R6U70_04625 [Bacillota bacterium]
MGQCLALEMARAGLSDLWEGRVDFIWVWAGQGHVEVAVELEDGSYAGGEVNARDLHMDESPDDAPLTEQEILEELVRWVQLSAPSDERDFHLIEDRHWGNYKNVVLELPQGYLWVQFDDLLALTKIRAHRSMPTPQ